MKKSELKFLLLESLLESLNQSQGDFDYLRGQHIAISDKRRGIENRDISEQSKEFKKGYDSVTEGWWQKFNNKLAQYAGAMGYSNQKRF